MPLEIGLDRRATFTVADRKAQYDAAMRVSGLFERMSGLVAKLGAIKAQTEAKIAKLPAGDPERVKAEALLARAEAIRGKVVATKEGGAITGEERLREHLDTAWGGVTFTEERPTPYHLERVNVLERELKEVEDEFAQLVATQVAELNTAFAVRKIAAIDVSVVEAPDVEAKGGPAAALATGLVGLRYYGSYEALGARGARD